MHKALSAILAILVASGALAQAQPQPSASRGQLLYTTHCVACHSTQMHWRDGRKAVDWDSLKAQVRRWQTNAGQTWNEADIAEVTRHLNDTIYHFAQTDSRVSQTGTPE